MRIVKVFSWAGLALAVFTAVIAQPAAPGTEKQVAVGQVSPVPITFDGNVSKFEYADATRSTFKNGHGTVEVATKAAGDYLYFAFEIPDLTPHRGDDIVIMLDTKNNRAAAPDKDDIQAYIRRKSENSRMYVGTGKEWENLYGDWEYKSTPYANGWEVEARIPLKTVGADFAKPATLGLAFRIWDNEPQKVWNWPAGSDENKPTTWGTLLLGK